MSENLVEAITEVRSEEVSQEVKESKVLWQKYLDIESHNFPRPHHGHDSKAVERSVIFPLAFQSIGVVYGDIGTSSLYVFSSTFPNGIKHNDDILGVLSLILYTLTLLSLIKYVLIVLKANDKGEGGTFALYSLLCRYAKVSFIPNQQAEDYEVSNYLIKSPNRRVQRASWLKSKLEKSKFAKHCLLFATMLGTSMLIGDGVLTPSISVCQALLIVRHNAWDFHAYRGWCPHSFNLRDDFWLFQNIGENDGEILDDGLVNKKNEKEDVREVEEDKQKEAVEREMEVVDKACHAGIVHLIGEIEVIANKEANIGKRIMIGYAYNFLKKNLGESDKVFDVPHKRMMKVGMTYEL
nr:isoform 2 of potassium transporter 1 [Quercus suber]